MGPSWFAVDRVFEGSGGWYIGSEDGFSIGPYDTVHAAQADADELHRGLAGTGGEVGEILQIARQLLERRQSHAPPIREFGMAQPARAGEPPRIGYRSPRLFALYGRWYLMTREGIDVGPYPSKDAAEQAGRRLIALLEHQHTDGQRRQVIFEFMTEAAGEP